MTRPSKRFFRFLSCLSIFMLCGQALATPFLVCGEMLVSFLPEASAMAAAPDGHHCDGMAMSPEVLPDAPATDAAQDSFKAMQDCDFLCQFHRSMNSEVADSMLVVSVLLLRRDGDSYSHNLRAPPVAVHFRPPIDA